MPPSLATLSDAELLRRTARDPDAFLVVHDRWAPVLHGWARRRIDGDAQAADVVAETFAQAFQHAGRFHDEVDGSAGPWLFGIATNVMRHSWRRAEVERRTNRRLLRREPALTETGYEQVEQRADADALAADLRTALAGLPEEQREAVRLRIVEQLSYDEVAARLACSNDAARLRVSRGLRRMRLLVLVVLTFLLLVAVAAATGLLSLPAGVVRTNPQVVRALDHRGAEIATVQCPGRRGDHPLCRALLGSGPAVAQQAERLRTAGATAAVVVSAMRCTTTGCRKVDRPDARARPDRPGVLSYGRTGIRVPTTARRTGGYRGTPSAAITHLTLPNRPAIACDPAAGGPAACRRLDAALAARPLRLSRLAQAMGVRWVILETATSCRLGTHLRCHAISLAAARRGSADPSALRQPGTTVDYRRTIVVAEH